MAESHDATGPAGDSASEAGRSARSVWGAPAPAAALAESPSNSPKLAPRAGRRASAEAEARPPGEVRASQSEPSSPQGVRRARRSGNVSLAVGAPPALPERARASAVWQWFSGLTAAARLDAVTLVDGREAGLLKQMFVRQQADGEGFFSEVGILDHGSGLLQRLPRSSAGAENFLFKRPLPLDNLFCYPQSVVMLEMQLQYGVRLCDTRRYCDTITLASDLVESVEAFFHMMDVSSRRGFLSSPCRLSQSGRSLRWEKPSWIQSMGYYSLGTYVASLVELALWQHYYYASGVDPLRLTDAAAGLPGDPAAPPREEVIHHLPTTAGLHTQSHLRAYWDGISSAERFALLRKVGSIVRNVVTDSAEANLEKLSRAASTSRRSWSSTQTEPLYPTAARSASLSELPARTHTPTHAAATASSPQKFDALTPSRRDITASVEAPVTDHLSLRRSSRAVANPSFHRPLETLLNLLVSISPDRASASLQAVAHSTTGLSAGGREWRVRLHEDAPHFLELVYLSPLDRAFMPIDYVLRRLGRVIHSSCATKLAMDLIVSDEDPDASSRAPARPKKKTKKKKRRPSTADAVSPPSVAATGGSSSSGAQPDSPEWKPSARRRASRRRSGDEAEGDIEEPESSRTSGSVSDAGADSPSAPVAAAKMGKTTRARTRSKPPVKGGLPDRGVSQAYDSQAAYAVQFDNEVDFPPFEGRRSDSEREPTESRWGVEARTPGPAESSARSAPQSVSTSPVDMSLLDRDEGPPGKVRRAKRATSKAGQSGAAVAGPWNRRAERVPVQKIRSSGRMPELQLANLDGAETFSPARLHGRGPALTQPSTVAWKLHEEVLEFQAYVDAEVRRRRPMHERLIESVRKAVTAVEETAEVQVYGSYTTRLQIMASDIDLVAVFTVEEARAGSLAQQLLRGDVQLDARAVAVAAKVKGVMMRTAERLRSEGWVSSMNVIDSASVPVIKIVHNPPDPADATPVRIDLTFAITLDHDSRALHPRWRAASRVRSLVVLRTLPNGMPISNLHMGLSTAQVVEDYMADLPALRPLTLLLKQYLLERGLNNPFMGGMSSYCLILLIVAFLKMFVPHKRQALLSGDGAAIASAVPDPAAQASSPPARACALRPP